MKITLNKEQMVKIGMAGLKVGKTIIIEGTKAVVAKGATKMIMEGFDNGIDGIKKMTLDDVLGKKIEEGSEEIKKEKKGFFKRKKKDKTEEIEVSIVKDEDGDIIAIVPKELADKKLKEISEEA